MDKIEASNTMNSIRAGTLAGPLQMFARETDRKFKPDLQFMRDVGSSEDLIPVGYYLDAIEQFEAASQDGSLLVRAGVLQNIGDIGVLGKAAVHAERLWDALQTLQQCIDYLVDQVEIKTRIRFGRCRVTYEHSFPDSLGADLDTQYSIAALSNVIHEALWTPASNMIIGFPGAKPEHKDFFPLAQLVSHTKVGFIEFDDTLLKSPMKKSNSALADVSRKMMDLSEAAPEEALDLSRQVKLLLLSSIRVANAPLKLQEAAYLLGISPRSLQLALRKQGDSFAKLRAQARHEIACEVLLTGYSITEAAELVGYSQRQTFSEAFSEWEGTSPSVYASRGKSDQATTPVQ